MQHKQDKKLSVKLDREHNHTENKEVFNKALFIAAHNKSATINS